MTLGQDFSNYIVNDRTLDSKSLITSYLEFLREHAPDEYSKYSEIDVDSEDYNDPDEIAWDLSELEDTLNEIAPLGHYFGASPGDGSCFGFWVNVPSSDIMTVMKNDNNTGLNIFYQCETDILYYNNLDERLLWDEARDRINHELETVEYILYIDDCDEIRVICDENLINYYKDWNIL